MSTATITAADIAFAIEGTVPTAKANDRIITPRGIYVDEVVELARELGAADVQVHPSPLFGRYSITVWMD